MQDERNFCLTLSRLSSSIFIHLIHFTHLIYSPVRLKFDKNLTPLSVASVSVPTKDTRKETAKAFPARAAYKVETVNYSLTFGSRGSWNKTSLDYDIKAPSNRSLNLLDPSAATSPRIFEPASRL